MMMTHTHLVLLLNKYKIGNMPTWKLAQTLNQETLTVVQAN